MCGAAVPGLLFLTTGLHTGHTRVTVEVLDAPAPIAWPRRSADAARMRTHAAAADGPEFVDELKGRLQVSLTRRARPFGNLMDIAPSP